MEVAASKGWKIHSAQFELETTAGTDILDVTPQLEAVLALSGVHEGLAVVHVPGSTAALTTIEFESGAVKDLRRAIERLAPQGEVYEHDRRWGDGNGYSHVRSALLGPSLALPVSGGRLALGTWQQVVLCDFDNRPRRRKVMVRLMGEGLEGTTVG
jgi:secondary thiamine-phosphate synthase enzyme